MATIGGYDVGRIEGALPNKGMAAEFAVRQGVHMEDIHIIGQRPNVGTVRTVTDSTAAATTLNLFSSLQGTLSVVTDDLSISNTYFVERVMPLETFAIKKAVSGSMVDRTRIVCEWTLRAV